jgi:fucose permease
MTHLLLIIIYAAFISLGLPDALLGAAWPAMYAELGVALSSAGIVSMVISVGTIFSSLFSSRLAHRMGTGAVTVASVAMTAIALLGFSRSDSFIKLCLWAIPYGLGAGSVDAVLNSFVALHYKSRHMSWLHCFWGLGATAGPYVMGRCLTGGLGWNSGYQIIGLVQVVLTAGLFLSLPLWRGKQQAADSGGESALGLGSAFAVPGVKEVLSAFLCYCALETTTGLWASSFLVLHHGISAEAAASGASLFYLGITLGRFLAGFISNTLGDVRMIRLGMGNAGLGALLLLLPLGPPAAFAGLLLVGLGCAPIFPSLIHQTPDNFGRAQSQAIMGLQMASAYVGSSFLPLAFGFLAEQVGVGLFPFFLLFFLGGACVMSERMNAIRTRRQEPPLTDHTA